MFINELERNKIAEKIFINGINFFKDKKEYQEIFYYFNESYERLSTGSFIYLSYFINLKQFFVDDFKYFKLFYENNLIPSNIYKFLLKKILNDLIKEKNSDNIEFLCFFINTYEKNDLELNNCLKKNIDVYFARIKPYKDINNVFLNNFHLSLFSCNNKLILFEEYACTNTRNKIKLFNNIKSF